MIWGYIALTLKEAFITLVSGHMTQVPLKNAYFSIETVDKIDVFPLFLSS